MSTFKVGDRVKIAERSSYSTGNSDAESRKGKIGTITSFGTSGNRDYANIDWENSNSKAFYLVDITLAKTMTSITEKFALAFLKEPQKSFRKAGITNGDNLLTDEGMKVFLTWMLTKNEAAFKTEVVDPMLEEMKDEK